MQEEFKRTAMLIGEEAVERLSKCRVAVFGVGGVGGYVVEALARSGVGRLDLIDNDIVSITNINRQIIATHNTLGMFKVDAAKDRILSINPKAEVNVFKTFYLPENSAQFDFSVYDYIVDAVDTVTAKIEIIENARKVEVPVISSMGTGNKLQPAMLEIDDIYKTSVCPLAKVMRHELRKRGIKNLKVLYSKEIPVRNEENTAEKRVPASISFVPSAAGLIIAGEVIRDLVKGDNI